MKNKIKVLICILFCTFVLLGCEKTPSKVSITEFEVNTMDVMADIGTKYTLKNISARDNLGGYYMAKIDVVDPDGNPVELSKLSFVCTKFGTYTVTYTVTYNEVDTISRSYKIEVSDVSEPKVETKLYEHNISTVGQTVNLDQFTVTDNSNEEIVHTTKVYFNGVLDESSVDGNVLTLTKEGCYTIEVTAKDSSDNTMIKEFNVYTLMDFESGYYFNNPAYATEITSKASYDGTHAYSIGAFDNHYSYFNDYSMLGCIQVLDRSMQYVSFWINFQNENFVDILKAQYHKTIIYDEFGDLLPAYNETGFELFGGRWYKVVVDMGDVCNLGETEDIKDVTANPVSLDLIPFYWGVWDSINNNSANRSQKVFIDNIMLTNDPSAGFKAPVKSDYEFKENCIADFESKDQLTALVGSWNTQLSLNQEIVYEGNNSLKFVPYAQWSHFGLKGSLGIEDLTSYNNITSKVYIEDNSTTNVYDSETYVVIDLRYTKDGTYYETVSSVVINDINKWCDVSFTLGAYKQYPLTSRKYDICIYKMVDGVAVDTGNYSDFAVYLDNLYVQ